MPNAKGKKKEHKPTVRIRRAEFAGAEDKFYAPSDDIRNCYLPIVRGGLEAVAASHPEFMEEFKECAQAYAKYYQDAFLSTDKVDVLVKKLDESLSGINQQAVSLCAGAIARAMLIYYGTAQRETSGHVDLTKPQIEKVAAIGSLLSQIDEEDRKEFQQILWRNRLYPVELDRDPQEGELIEREDNKDTEEAGRIQQPSLPGMV